jgi:hypothetical protein
MGKSIHDGIDMLTLYAYSDDAEQVGRASWRGFLSFVVSSILELDSETTDELIAAAILGSPETVDAPHVSQTVLALHSISAELAAALGMPLEFGFAALLDFRPPTRVTPLGRKQEQLQEDALIALWLRTFQERQQDSAFQQLVDGWKNMLETVLTEELQTEDDIIPEDFDAVDEVENNSQQSQKKKTI